MSDLSHLLQSWRARWEDALGCWSRFTRLLEPRWCVTESDEKREQLSGSFAMIRFADHAVVISLRQIEMRGLQRFATEIMAHEIGHHVLCPADARDFTRLIARLRRGLPTLESRAPAIGNLYADLLINDRLTRECGLNLAGVYRALGKSDEDGALWRLYTRIYEHLWHLPTGDLCAGAPSAPSFEADAYLGAKLIRSYRTEWLGGAGRFAALCLPYILEDLSKKGEFALKGIGDLQDSCRDCSPDGLAGIDEDEAADAVHPVEDEARGGGAYRRSHPEITGGKKSERRYRDPVEYRELLEATGTKASAKALAAKYYRERAMPHLIPFPPRQSAVVSEPQPEGLVEWDGGEPLESIDWIHTLLRSATVIPGVTTVQRSYGVTEGMERGERPCDLYIGMDCSGSMPNPRESLSYPTLAGTILALSALRAGARVQVVLSGEPGQTVSTRGFVRDESAILEILTDYLGAGIGFGVHRLAEVFDARKPADPATNIVIITDRDVLDLLDGPARGARGQALSSQIGWEIAARALARARGNGSFVLHMPRAWSDPRLERLRQEGWRTHRLSTWDELIQFARSYARDLYSEIR
ncbi:MAG: VWA domain-containing protein [Planctomycetes bacterium]|nr:VWA domain-containing protein [Planctomycetota bacterium]